MVFAGETVIVLVLLTFVHRIGDRPAGERVELDVVGAALSALGLGLTVFSILKISTWGLFKPIGALTIAGTRITPFGFSVVPFLILAGLVILGLFARWEQRVAAAGRTPLLAPDLLHIPQLRAGLSTLVSQYLILAGTFFVLPLYLQLVLGKNALETGVAILPISVTMMLAAVLGPRLATRTSPRRVVQIGLGFLFVSIACLMASDLPVALLRRVRAVAGGLRRRDRPGVLPARQRRDVLRRRIALLRGRRRAGRRAEPRPVARHRADRRGAAHRPDDRLSRARARRPLDSRARAAAGGERHRGGPADGLPGAVRSGRPAGGTAAGAGRRS